MASYTEDTDYTWDGTTLTFYQDGVSGGVKTWTIVDDGSGNYAFTQLEAIDHTDTTDDNEPATWAVTATVTDGDGDTASADFNVTINDDGHINLNDAMIIGDNVAGFTDTDLLPGITMSVDAQSTASWDVDNMPVIFHGTDEVSYLVHTDGTLVGFTGVDPIGATLSEEAGTGNIIVTGGTTIFNANIIIPSGNSTPSYDFNLITGPIGTPVIYDNFTQVSGGNVGDLYLDFEDTYIAHLSGTDPDGAGTVNTNSGTIGVSDGQRINPGETLTIEFFDPTTYPGSEDTVYVGGLNFTGYATGSSDELEVTWTATFIDPNGTLPDLVDISDSSYYASTEDGLLEFSINPPAGYQIQSITLNSPDDLDFQGDFKLTFSIDGPTVYEDVAFDLPYSLTDADGDAVVAELSVHLDSDENGVDLFTGTSGNDAIDSDAAGHIDGGLGYDTLLVEDNGVLDFSNVDNFEKVELDATSVPQNVVISLDDVLDMTDSDNVLQITGEASDSVTLTGLGSADGQWAQDTTDSGLFTQNGTGIQVTIAPLDDSIDIHVDVDNGDSFDV